MLALSVPRCPKCRSSQIWPGYNKPPLILRLILIRELLCNNCNLIFRAFALPGTVRQRKRHDKSPRQQRTRDLTQPRREPTPTTSQSQIIETSNGSPLDYLRFIFYYIKLVVLIFLGLHQTTHPLGLKYRWKNWQHWRKQRHLVPD